MDNLPDLLYLQPRADRDMQGTEQRLDFAFSTGDSGGALGQALDQAQAGESDWDPGSYAEDLFVDHLIDSSLRVSLGGEPTPQSLPLLWRHLCNPPRDLETVRFRQALLRELIQRQPLREEFESIYLELIELRTVLDTQGLMGLGYSTRRRIDILSQVKQAIDRMAASFEDAGPGLGRIRNYALELQQTEGYSRLAEFLDYEDNLAQVQVRLRVGADGRVRDFQIVTLQENERNRYHETPFRRFIEKLRLLWRGITVRNDELVERWVDAVFDGVRTPLAQAMFLIGDMEFYLSALAFRARCAEHELPVCFPEFLPAGSDEGRFVQDLFNPLLLDQEQPTVPGDLRTNRHEAMVIITGPNSGGKTRLLQALGLLQLLGQVGFVVPAKSARIRFGNGLFVSLMEGAKADQREGRLGMELLRIRRLFERGQRGGVVVLDELCSGTNPSEGEEIFSLVISLLPELDLEAFISTHFLRFAQQLQERSGDDLEFLQVELDAEQVPTYRFVPGVAGSSLAQHTAERLGVTRDELLALINRRRT